MTTERHYNVAVQVITDDEGHRHIEWAELTSEKCNQWLEEDGLPHFYEVK